MKIKFNLLQAIGIMAMLILNHDTSLFGDEPARTTPIRLACIGDSITFGMGTAMPELQSYPWLLGNMLGDGWDTRNFGVSATTLLHRGSLPYIKQSAYTNALEFRPDVVVINLGANDSKHPGDGSLEADNAENNWRFKNDYISDYEAMINAFKQVNPAVKVFICFPTPDYPGRWGINDRTIREEMIPMIRTVAKGTGASVIDLYSALSGKRELFPDTVHPNYLGYRLIARSVYRSLAGKDYEGEIPIVRHSQWNGYAQDEFVLDYNYCRVVKPKSFAPGKPWIWRPELFGEFDQADRALLEKGYAVVFIEMYHLYGSPAAMKVMDQFYDKITTEYGFSKKTTLFGFSLGGLIALNWAEKHPNHIACIYLDAPVCDFKSWPAGHGKCNGSPEEWKYLKECYGFKSDDEAFGYKAGPLENLKPLSKARIPILSVSGDADSIVPYEENTALLMERYRSGGGMIDVIVKPGCGHLPQSLENPQPIMDFVLKHN